MPSVTNPLFFFNYSFVNVFVYIEKHGVSEQRIAAREKLSRLLQNQLQDLSTDVYDELKRRTDGAKGKCCQSKQTTTKALLKVGYQNFFESESKYNNGSSN